MVGIAPFGASPPSWGGEGSLNEGSLNGVVVGKARAHRVARTMLLFRPRAVERSGGGGPCQRVRPEVAGPMTSSAWWRGHAAIELAAKSDAPPTALRAVPPPRYAGRDKDGHAASAGPACPHETGKLFNGRRANHGQCDCQTKPPP